MSYISKIKLPNGNIYDINATTVNGHKVNSDVPENAKFTDTTYDAASPSSNGLMTASDKQKLDSITEKSIKTKILPLTYGDVFKIL